MEECGLYSFGVDLVKMIELLGASDFDMLPICPSFEGLQSCDHGETAEAMRIDYTPASKELGKMVSVALFLGAIARNSWTVVRSLRAISGQHRWGDDGAMVIFDAWKTTVSRG